MYEDHFGLKSRPFGAKAEGKDVFVGPTQSKTVAALHKGLSLPDAVVTVSGPVGVGKTSIVTRSLESIPDNRMVAWIGRMQLAPEELLELVLAGFGIGRKVKGTVRKIAAFRRLQRERSSSGPRVAIVVEDSRRLGVDALLELEALTAADSGDDSSANIILMGQPGLEKFLQDPELARLMQRRRNRLKIEPLNAAEVKGYLKHCMREAGGDYDLIFDQGVAGLVHQCSGGIPRVINNVCEAALIAAMDEHSAQITTALFAQVAADTLGFDIDNATDDSVAVVENEESATAPVIVEDPIAPQKSQASSDDTQHSNSDEPSVSAEDPGEPDDKPELAATAETEDVQAPTDGTDEDSEGEPVAAIRTNTKADIDWDAIAPPPLPRSDIRDASNETAPAIDPAPIKGRQLDVESGMHPNIDDVISASKAENADHHLIDENSGEKLTETSDVKESETINNSSEFDLSPIPDLIDDTQPELRELPDFSDEPASANDVTDLPKAENAKDENIPTLLPDVESSQSITTTEDDLLDDDVKAYAKSEFDDASFELDAALTGEVDPTNLVQGVTPNLDAIAQEAPEMAPELSSEEKSTIEVSTKLSEQSEEPMETIAAAIEAPEPEKNDDQAEISAELPTLSDSMRIGIPDAKSIERDISSSDSNNSIAADTALDSTEPGEIVASALTVVSDSDTSLDTDEAPALRVESDDPENEPTEHISSEVSELQASLEPKSDTPIALVTETKNESITEEESGKGIFDELDPLPDFDDLDESQTNDDVESEALTYTKEDGAISVTNLTIANSFDKSKNDIDALEAALEAAKQGKISAPPPIEQPFASQLNGDVTSADPSSNDDDDTIDVPQITLDDELEKRKPPPIDLEKLALEIGTADSLEDFSASMAETLFGSEAFDQIAAQVAANPPLVESSPVALEVDDASQVQLDESEIASAANDTSDNVLTLEPDTPEPSITKPTSTETSAASVDVKARTDAPSVDDSIAMRIDILNRAKNNVAGMAMENVELGESNLSTTSDGMKSPKPEPIENQINTSITQTLEALSVEKMAKMEQEQVEEEEEKPKKKSGGLFARFRKSS